VKALSSTYKAFKRLLYY